MKYVYILESLDIPSSFYIGITDDLRARLTKHNAGEVRTRRKYGPGDSRLTSPSVTKRRRSHSRRFLKSASGRAFAKKRL